MWNGIPSYRDPRSKPLGPVGKTVVTLLLLGLVATLAYGCVTGTVVTDG